MAATTIANFASSGSARTCDLISSIKPLTFPASRHIRESRSEPCPLSFSPTATAKVADGEGTRHVDQERADGKIAMIVLVDDTPGEPAQQ